MLQAFDLFTDRGLRLITEPEWWILFHVFPDCPEGLVYGSGLSDKTSAQVTMQQMVLQGQPFPKRKASLIALDAEERGLMAIE